VHRINRRTRIHRNNGRIPPDGAAPAASRDGRDVPGTHTGAITGHRGLDGQRAG
jgi:hypothetical protein